jgi:RNA polymerase sigma-70 factor, ECF subfamily
MDDPKIRQEFESLTLRYLDSLYQFAFLLTREKDTAEDLVQDTYIRAYRFYSQYECGTNYKAWLFTVMRNLFINRFHQRAREISLSGMDLEPPEENGNGNGAGNGDFSSSHSILEKGIFRLDIQKALDGLPEPLRAVVVLKDVEGFDYKEISDILDCPMGTVMSRLSRGRKLLKTRLKDYAKSRSPLNGRVKPASQMNGHDLTLKDPFSIKDS